LEVPFRVTIDKILVFPHLDYCASVLLGVSSGQLRRIQRVYCVVIRWVYGVKCSGSIADRISTHGILPSEVKIKQLILCVVYLSFRGKTSYYPTELLRLKIYTKILRSLSCPALLCFCVSLSQLLKTYWSNFQKNCIHGKLNNCSVQVSQNSTSESPTLSDTFLFCLVLLQFSFGD
jgi:hypothetical protein